MTIIGMELRGADVSRREIVGIVAPYDRPTYLVADPGGEVLARGAFTKSITERPTRIPLFLNHNHDTIYGYSASWDDGPGELRAVFKVRDDDAGTKILIDASEGYLPGMSIDFRPIQSRRRGDGVRVISEAKLAGVSLVTVPAYDDAQVLATRSADAPRIDVAAMFGPRPDVDLSPVPRFWG
jgi:HK97 family phage prohead protease